MARFDVFRLRGSDSLVLDCQADVLRGLSTRLVVPLLPCSDAPPPISRLNPVFAIDGTDFVMMTQFAAAIETRELGPAIGSLVEHDTRIANALDLLVTGV